MGFTTLGSMESPDESGFFILAGMTPPLAGRPPPLAGAPPPLAGQMDNFITDPSEVRLTQNTGIINLFGNKSSAVIVESYETKGKKFNIGYHHHDNFNTKSDEDGETGFGGYHTLNVGSTKIKQTMNGQLNIDQLIENHKLKQDATWMTQQGNKEQEAYFQKVLSAYNKSDNFSKTVIENSNDLISLIAKAHK